MKKEPTKKIKCHIKKNDLVKVIAGNEKNKIGKVIAINTRKYRAIVEGVNVRIFHIKPTQQTKGKREKKEASLHISNLMLIDPTSQEPTRIGRKRNDNNKLQRYAKKNKQFI